MGLLPFRLFELKSPPRFPSTCTDPLPDPLPADYRNQMATIGTDALFICATRNATTSLANLRSRRSPTFLYMYNHIMSWSAAEWGPDSPYCYDVVCHGADLAQVFHPDYPQVNGERAWRVL